MVFRIYRFWRFRSNSVLLKRKVSIWTWKKRNISSISNMIVFTKKSEKKLTFSVFLKKISSSTDRLSNTYGMKSLNVINLFAVHHTRILFFFLINKTDTFICVCLIILCIKPQLLPKSIHILHRKMKDMLYRHHL